MDSSFKKSALTKKDSFENIRKTSEGKPNYIETDRRKFFYNSIFQNFAKRNNIKPSSGNRSLGAVFVKKIRLTIKDLLKRPILHSRDGNWIDIFPKTTKQYNNSFFH